MMMTADASCLTWEYGGGVEQMTSSHVTWAQRASEHDVAETPTAASLKE